jgi:hypothetical protein
MADDGHGYNPCMHPHTADDGHGYNPCMHLHTADDGHGYTLHVPSQGRRWTWIQPARPHFLCSRWIHHACPVHTTDHIIVGVKVFLTVFALMVEGSRAGSGSVSQTNRSGSGSRRPENQDPDQDSIPSGKYRIWIRVRCGIADPGFLSRILIFSIPDPNFSATDP